uniref:Uncharacterized protein n=1 Tax=Panagrolaimus superbus TaxID=310955 RepID=A0A914YVG8_9BILA
MKVTRLWYNRKEHSIPSEAEQNILNKSGSKTFYEKSFIDLLCVMSVCNKAQFEHPSESFTRVSTKMLLEQKTKSQNAKLTKKFTIITQSGRLSVKEPTEDLKGMEEGKKPDDYWNVTKKGSSKKKKNNLIGMSLEVALLRYVETVTSVEAIRPRFPKLFEIPFNSVRRWQLVIARCQAKPQSVDALELLEDLQNDQVINVVMMKGAPEEILAKCSHYVLHDELKEIDEDFRNECKDAWEHYGCEGNRVLGFALKHFVSDAHAKFTNESTNYPQEKLVFIGLSAAIDPPKPQVAEAIQQCKDAGIKVYMITGTVVKGNSL